MRWVSYTRAISCKDTEDAKDVAADIINRQNLRIQEFMAGHGWTVEKKYSDRKRKKDADEAFKQMLHDGMNRQFDAVVVDSIYRCGPSLYEARDILARTFYPAGISFAVVEDAFYSEGKSVEEVEAYFAGKIDKTPVWKKSGTNTELMSRHIYDGRTGVRLGCITFPDEGGSQYYGVRRRFHIYTQEERDRMVPKEAVVAAVTEKLKWAAGKSAYILEILKNGGYKPYMERELKPLREEGNKLLQELNAICLERIKVHKAHDAGELDDVSFSAEESRFEEAFAKNEESFQSMKVKADEIKKTYSPGNPWLYLYSRMELPENLEHNYVMKYTDRVLVYGPEHIEVVLKRTEWMERLPHEWLTQGLEG